MNDGNFPGDMGKHCPYCHQNIEDSLFDAHLHNHKVENNEINLNRPPLSINNFHQPQISPSPVPIISISQDPKIPSILPPVPINNNSYFYPPPIVYPPNYFNQNNDNEVQMNNNINNNNQFIPHPPPPYPPFGNGNNGIVYATPRPQQLPPDFVPPRIRIGGAPPEVIENINKGYCSLSDQEIEEIMNNLSNKTLSEKMEGEHNNCIICLSDFENGDIISTLPCSHMYHSSCLKDWLKSMNCCPVCKSKITLKIIKDNK